jgi:gamma-glutamylaminecyclotransferase
VAEVEARFLLFAYGSLKRGLSNHHELGPARFVAETRTAPSFALRLLSGYPLLVPGTESIRGELFDLPAPQLAALDAFEGAPYARREIELADGGRAVAYLASDPSAGEPYSASEWPAPAPG